MQGYHFEEMQGRKMLALGESGSGKTRLMVSLLKEAAAIVEPEKITLLDFAPTARSVGGVGIGGKIADIHKGVHSLHHCSPSIRAPRLEGRTREEVLSIAGQNASRTTRCLRAYLYSPTPVLFVNDLSLHLHAGDPNMLLDAISRSETFVGNAYQGSLLSNDRGSGVSERESRLLDYISLRLDFTVRLPLTVQS